jgi:mannose-6-phosphate isomerase-like protein (cupin superfamily)
MEVRSREEAEAFTTVDGSEIRVLLDAPRGGARKQSLAEATLAPGRATVLHHHARTEEIYVVLAGVGEMEVEGERRGVAPGDAILIPAGARHRIRADAAAELRFLCCCAPAYADEDTFLEEEDG